MHFNFIEKYDKMVGKCNKNTVLEIKIAEKKELLQLKTKKKKLKHENSVMLLNLNF